MTEPTGSQSGNTFVAWLIVVLGTAAALGWVLVGQKLGDMITITDPAPAMSLYYAVLFVPLVLLALGLGWIGKIRVLRAGEMPGRWGALGFVLGAAGLLATIGFAALNGGLVAGAEPGGGLGLVSLGVLLTLFQTGTEELVFRGWLQPALIGRIGAVAGIGLGALIFAAFHLTAGVRSPVSLVNLLLGGIWFGLLAWRSQGLIAPLAAHFAWNAIEDLGFGLVPNPGTGPLGALTDHDIAGAVLWGAHEEGLNASIGTTAVLIALILPLLVRSRAASPVAAGAATT